MEAKYSPFWKKIFLSGRYSNFEVSPQSPRVNLQRFKQGEGREGVETPIHRADPSVMRASRGVRRSNCKQIWLRVHDPSEGMLKLLLYKILLV